MKILFLGNHNVGIQAIKALLDAENEIIGVVAHPEDPEDGVIYESLFEFCTVLKLNVVRGQISDPKIYRFIKELNFDLIWVTDYRYLIPSDILKLPPYGSINLHPSLLPKFRGRAPINWAILRGEKILGLSAHFIDIGIDTGPIIKQVKYTLSRNEDVGDALSKLMPIYYDLTKKVIQMITTGKVRTIKQNHSLATTFKARKPDDGLINWDNKAEDIVNLIRAVSKPYPGARAVINNNSYIFWKAKLLNNKVKNFKYPFVYNEKTGLYINCRVGNIKITEFNLTNEADTP